MTTKTTKQTWIHPETQAVFEATLQSQFEFAAVRASSPRGRVVLSAQFAQRLAHLRALPRRSRRALERTWKKPLAAIALLSTLGQGTALAATINVDANTPPEIKANGKCSLVEAIINANDDVATHRDCVAGRGVDTIVLPQASQQLGSGYLSDIGSTVVIEGHGSLLGGITISRNGDLTLNHATISGETIFNSGKLTLNYSDIVNCQGVAALENHGGTVTLRSSTVANNHQYEHGAIVNLGGHMTLVNSTVRNNTGWSSGGGLYNDATSTLWVNDSTIVGNGSSYGSGGGIGNSGTLIVKSSRILQNTSDELGGGIFNDASGTVTVSDSVIAGNTSEERYSGSGGGIGNKGKFVVTNTTISDNLADGTYSGFPAHGGGVFNDGTLTITNSTISNNAARGNPNDDPKLAYGGGIFNRGQLTLANTTITGNQSEHGGGIYVRAGHVTLARSLVAGNIAVQRGPEIENRATIVANNFNLIGHSGKPGAVGFAPGARDIVPTKPLTGILLPLAHNSSKTKTHALAINSPALNASPADDGCPAKDQRGAVRPQGAGCDIGAFEGSAVMCNGVVSTHVGTAGNDVIYGTPGPDVIAGLGGNDTLQGLDGDDMICGGSGKDSLIGGKGIDALMGDAGDDVLRGQAGDDILNGGPGTDTCDGGTNGAAGDVAAQCENVVNVP